MFKKVEKTKNGDATGEKKHQRTIATRRKDKRNKKKCAPKKKEKHDKKNKVKMWKKVDEKNEGRKIQDEN